MVPLPDSQQSVEHDEAYGQGGNLTGHQAKYPGQATQDGSLPGPALPQELTTVKQVSRADDGQEQAHTQVGEAQTRHKHVETQP